MISFLLPLLLLSPASVSDGFSSGGHVHLIRVKSGKRFIDDGKRTSPVPKSATFVVPCEGRYRYLFVSHEGVLRADGSLLAKRETLFAAADPSHLYVAPLCAPDGKTLRLPTQKGIEILSVDDGKHLQTLPFKPRAKTYSGHVHQGRSRERAYAVALSVYVPRMMDFDTNQDGLLDLVVLSDAVLSIYRKKVDGSYAPHRIRHDLRRLLSVPAGRPLHVVFGDIDDDGSAAIVLSHSEGIVPSETHIAIYDVNRGALKKRLAEIHEGWWFPMVAQNGAWFRQIDTSLLSLGQALMTQEADMTLWRFAKNELKEHTTLRAHFDLRSRRQTSQLPLLADLNGDGWPELTTLSKEHVLEIRQGTPEGFLEPSVKKSMAKETVWVPSTQQLLVIEVEKGKLHRLSLPKKRHSRRR
ncbi:MAG: VCBS repeat-containing protein [Deltaproteobacteria bacterium]|nr:VCBS repeat-containing protein [Deltaproteobacteria bacterium]